jgi:hypothetical protein
MRLILEKFISLRACFVHFNSTKVTLSYSQIHHIANEVKNSQESNVWNIMLYNFVILHQ